MKITVAEKSKIEFDSKSVKISFKKEITESQLVVKEKEETLEMKLLDKEKLDYRQLVILTRQIIFYAKKYGIRKIILDWEEVKLLLEKSVKKPGEILAVNLEMANYEFVRYKEKPKEGWNFVEEVMIISKIKNVELAKEIKKGQLIGREINQVRELTNTPGGEMTPQLLEREIRQAIKGTNMKMKVLEEADMKKLSMGAILGVAKGSLEKPKFIILEYEGKKEKNPIVLVGKGVTFDAGGLNIKSGDGMNEMHMDMSGGAAVAFAAILASKLGIKKKIVALIPTVENMPSGESLRPNDILKSMSGKTIEVQNTDAEGRIILADALTYAEKYSPRLVVDVATLTGAAVVALGQKASVIMSKDEALIENTKRLGEESGDYVWPLPLWEEYEKEVEGVFADVCNLRKEGNTRDGGTILGGAFLYQFAKKFPAWMHIDMAPRDHSSDDEFLAKGSAGAPVRLLFKLLESY